MLIEPGVVATELPTHITDADTKRTAEQTYEQIAISPR